MADHSIDRRYRVPEPTWEYYEGAEITVEYSSKSLEVTISEKTTGASMGCFTLPRNTALEEAFNIGRRYVEEVS